MSARPRYQELLARQRSDFDDGALAAARRLRWSADRLAAHRQQRLRELLAWSVERSGFHRDRLAGVDIEGFTEADLPSLPTMTRADMMGNFDRVVTDPAITLERANDYIDQLDGDGYLADQYRVIGTSGTTGTRALHVYGWKDWCDFAHIVTRWQPPGLADLPGGPRTASLFAANARHVSGALQAFFTNSSPEGSGAPMAHLPASLPVPEIIEGLNRAQPTVLQGYPTVIHLLALEAAAGRLDIHPRHVLTCGEQCTEDARRAVRQVWGVEIYDYWGCTEGVYAFPCYAGRAMHLPDDLVIVETADRHGNVVPAGQQGEKILVTSLYQLAQPLIRYEIADSMKLVTAPCECGCAHRRVDDLAGRTDSFFFYEGGAAVHPMGMVTALLGGDSVAEFQVTQTQRGVDVTIVARRPCNLEAMRLSLVDLMTKAGLREPEVKLSEVDSLERLGSGKLRQFQPLP